MPSRFFFFVLKSSTNIENLRLVIVITYRALRRCIRIGKSSFSLKVKRGWYAVMRMLQCICVYLFSSRTSVLDSRGENLISNKFVDSLIETDILLIGNINHEQ